MRTPTLLASLASLLAFATSAPDARAFGGSARELERQGTFVITNNAGFSLTHQIGNGDGTTFTVRPALDYMVIPRLSLGGAVELDFVSGNPDRTVFALAPEIGYEAALSDTWSIWPQAALNIAFPNPGNPTLTLVLFVPFLIHPAEHFFFGIGPGLSQDLTSNPTTLLQGRFMIGGYFDH